MRVGDWIQTFTGRAFYPFDVRVEDICIEDIAHALAHQCRFAGHCRDFYSVAEHCVRVSYIVPPEQALLGLLHDAAEAYIVDLPRPIKRSEALAPYVQLESEVLDMIAIAFGIFGPIETPEVKRADAALLATEARDVMAAPPMGWYLPEPPDGGPIIAPWSPKVAERTYLDRFYALPHDPAAAAPRRGARGRSEPKCR